MKEMIVLISMMGCTIFLFATWSRHTVPNVCVEQETAVSIGGCNSEGWCGVITTSGKNATALFPVAGGPVCTKWVTISEAGQ